MGKFKNKIPSVEGPTDGRGEALLKRCQEVRGVSFESWERKDAAKLASELWDYLTDVLKGDELLMFNTYSRAIKVAEYDRGLERGMIAVIERHLKDLKDI